MKYRYRLTKNGIIGILFIIIIVIVIAYSSSKFKQSLNDYPLFLTSAPIEYLGLFKDSCKRELTISQTLVFKSKSPIAHFNYKKKFFIEVYRIDSLTDKSLKNLITIESENHLKIDDIGYNSVHGSLFSIYYNSKMVKPNSIKLNLFGQIINNVAINDTTISVFSNFKIFSINYNRMEIPSIYAETQENYPDIPGISLPINIVFLKKGKNLYLLIMSVNNHNTKFSHELLSTMIK